MPQLHSSLVNYGRRKTVVYNLTSRYNAQRSSRTTESSVPEGIMNDRTILSCRSLTNVAMQYFRANSSGSSACSLECFGEPCRARTLLVVEATAEITFASCTEYSLLLPSQRDGYATPTRPFSIHATPCPTVPKGRACVDWWATSKGGCWRARWWCGK